MRAHIRFDPVNMRLLLLDQRQLPLAEVVTTCASYTEVIAAIKNMTVRGAPAIGIAAAWACALAAHESLKAPDSQEFLERALAEIRQARPTAVNLAWAVDKMRDAIAKTQSGDLLAALMAEAAAIQEKDIAACAAIGKNGAPLIKDGDTVLTHCNAGALATGGYGTALGVIRAAVEEGKKVKVIADETRPLLQGARLTAWELAQDHIPVTIACDNACGHLLSQKKVNLVITGADRIAANGDSANKIGTLGVAIIAKYYGIPFYIAAPLSTFDPLLPNGAAIPIESRSQEEVLTFAGRRIAPENVEACNFAFDVTPAELITAIITEKGILRPPFAKAIANIFNS